MPSPNKPAPWQPPKVERRSLPGIYDDDKPTKQTTAKAAEPIALEAALGTAVVRHLDAVGREVGFALSGLSVQVTAEGIQELEERIVQRVLERLRETLGSEDADEWLTTLEAAAFLKVSRQRLYDLKTQRTLMPFKVGRSNRYKRSQLDAFARGEHGVTARRGRRG